ncbi:hypothetical protein [Nocardia testacea]|uniref:hypothetical protein n=1 Tax=Nocardia testacea TaxID=248551 RepID=UPI0033E90F6D
MSEVSFDDLEFARQQLHLAVEEFSGIEMAPQDRVQLGLLAAQVALSDRISALISGTVTAEVATVEHSPIVDDPSVGDKTAEDGPWTPALCERILQSSTPGGFRLVKALVAEGGSASIARLTELTGDPLLRAATQSLNMAARREGAFRYLPEGRLIQSHRYPNPLTSRVAAYSLPTESIPAFTTAVELLGELQRRLYEQPAP